MRKCHEGNYIKRLKRKKEDALEFIIDRHLGMVKGCVTKVLGPTSQVEAIGECMNDIFLAIWEHADQFQGEEEDFKRWVYRIAKYQAIDYYRRLSRKQEVALEEENLGQVRSSEEEVILSENREELLELMKTLGPLDQRIFILKYFLEIGSEEIGRQVGLSRTAVDNRLYRGKKKLNENLKKLEWRGV